MRTATTVLTLLALASAMGHPSSASGTAEFLSAHRDDLMENKFYARGVGNVLTVDATTGERSELIRVTTE